MSRWPNGHPPIGSWGPSREIRRGVPTQWGVVVQQDGLVRGRLEQQEHSGVHSQVVSTLLDLELDIFFLFPLHSILVHFFLHSILLYCFEKVSQFLDSRHFLHSFRARVIKFKNHVHSQGIGMCRFTPSCLVHWCTRTEFGRRRLKELIDDSKSDLY